VKTAVDLAENIRDMMFPAATMVAPLPRHIQKEPSE